MHNSFAFSQKVPPTEHCTNLPPPPNVPPSLPCQRTALPTRGRAKATSVTNFHATVADSEQYREGLLWLPERTCNDYGGGGARWWRWWRRWRWWWWWWWLSTWIAHLCVADARARTARMRRGKQPHQPATAAQCTTRFILLAHGAASSRPCRTSTRHSAQRTALPTRG